MPEEDPTLQFELNEEAIGLVLKSVSFYLERWPGGPDPSEQEGLIKLKSLFAAALLEFPMCSLRLQASLKTRDQCVLTSF